MERPTLNTVVAQTLSSCQPFPINIFTQTHTIIHTYIHCLTYVKKLVCHYKANLKKRNVLSFIYALTLINFKYHCFFFCISSRNFLHLFFHFFSHSDFSFCSIFFKSCRDIYFNVRTQEKLLVEMKIKSKN